MNQANLQKGPEAGQGCFQERKKSYTEMTQSAIQQVSDSLNEPDVIELVQDIINHEKVAAFGLMKAETAAHFTE